MKYEQPNFISMAEMGNSVTCDKINAGNSGSYLTFAKLTKESLL